MKTTQVEASVSVPSDTRIKSITRKVCLSGLTDVLFDRYPGENSTRLEWHQKVYLRPGSSTVCLPALNISSLLSSHNTNSAPKRLRDKRKFKDICNANLSFVLIAAPDGTPWIPFLREGKQIEIGVPGVDRDEKSGIYLARHTARLDKGIPNAKERPALPLPWELKFVLRILPNREVKEQELRNLLEEAGAAIGIGTYRGVYGKFEIIEWS